MNYLKAIFFVTSSFIGSSVLAQEAEIWLRQLSEIGFWEQLAEIKSVSEFADDKQKQRVPALLVLLKDNDQSIRITTAKELAEIHKNAPSAIPPLIDNFKFENGEEAAVYIESVATFGDIALPLLKTALQNKDELIRSRACDSIQIIEPKMYLDGECKQQTPCANNQKI